MSDPAPRPSWLAEPSPEAGPWRRGVNAISAVLLVLPAALVAYLVGSLALTGGQVGPARPPIWHAVLPFPLFPTPMWLAVPVAALGALAATTWALATIGRWPGPVTGWLGPLGANAVALLVFRGVTGAAWAVAGIGLAALGVAAVTLVARLVLSDAPRERVQRAQFDRDFAAWRERNGE